MIDHVWVLPVVLVFFYAVKRYFDDRTAARAHMAKLAAVDDTRTVRQELATHEAFIRERFEVHEKALANAITQFAAFVDAKNKATAAVLNRSARRMPAP